MSHQAETRGGVGFFGLLGIMFIGLKLGGVINWSWIAVLSPLWGPVAFAIALLVVAFAIGMFTSKE